MEIKDKIKQLLDDKNITVSELAKVLNRTKGSVYGYMRGETPIDLDGLLLICEKYEVPISYFIKDDEKKELLTEIDKLKQQIDRLEYYLIKLVFETIDHSKREIPMPDDIYDFPQIRNLSKQYDLDKAREKKMKKYLTD